MTLLDQYKQAGVKELSVNNHEAVAVNPHESPDGIVKWATAQFLPPLPTSGIPDGTVSIEEVEEEEQYYSAYDEIWKGGEIISGLPKRTALVKKQVKEEEPKAERYTEGNCPDCGDAPFMNCEKCAPVQAPEQTAEGILIDVCGTTRDEYDNEIIKSSTEYVIQAMQTYADSQLAQYKEKLIKNLELILKNYQDVGLTDEAKGVNHSINLIEYLR